MANTYANWFTSIAKNKDFNLDPSELTALNAYLNGILSIPEAASQLTAPTPQKWNSSKSGRLWTMILFLVQDHEEAHEEIIPLLQAIFDLPKSSDETDWAVEKEIGFPESWRDTHDSLWSQNLEDKSPSSPIRNKWINYHAFTAHLSAAAILPSAYWAKHLTVDALEKKIDLAKPTAHQDGNIAAAAQYFIFSAKHILDSPMGDSGVYSTSWGDESELWHGKKGFSMERWEFWKERFGKMRVAEALSERTKEAARRAEVGMEKAERQGKKKGGR